MIECCNEGSPAARQFRPPLDIFQRFACCGIRSILTTLLKFGVWWTLLLLWRFSPIGEFAKGFESGSHQTNHVFRFLPEGASFELVFDILYPQLISFDIYLKEVIVSLSNGFREDFAVLSPWSKNA